MTILSKHNGKLNKVSERHKNRFVRGAGKGALSELNPIQGIKEIVAMEGGKGIPARSKNEKRFDSMMYQSGVVDRNAVKKAMKNKIK